MKTLNVRLFVILAVSTVVVAGAVYVLHGFQVRRNAGVFLDQARKSLAEAEAIEGDSEEETAAKREKLYNAVRNYTWFVRMRPDNVDALEELGGLQMDVLQYPQALGTLERVVRLDPSRSEARRKLVDITMAFGRFEDAKTHLQQYLLREDPKNAELYELLGICQLMEGKNREAVKTLEKAIEYNPSQLQAYRYLAVALRFRLQENEAADEWIRKMIQANPQSFEAQLLAGNYFQTTEAFEEAIAHARKAIALEPENRDGLWLMAQCELGLEHLEEARQYAVKGIEEYPEHIPMYAIAADVALREGKRDEAIAFITRGLGATDRAPQLLWYLGNLYLDGGELSMAKKMVAELKDTDFSEARTTYLEARLAIQEGLWQDAARKLERIRSQLAQWPNLMKQADYWRGRCYQHLGDRKQAEAAYRNALSIDRTFGPARAALADLMAASGELDEAVGEFGQMLRMADPTPAGLAHYARLSILRTLQLPAKERNWAAAERAIGELEKAAPGSPDAVRLRAEVLLAQDQGEAAVKLVTDALEKNPDELGLWLTRIALAMRIKEWDDAEQLLAQARERFGDVVLLRLVKARYLVGRYGAKASDELRFLADGLDQYPEQQRYQLLLGLISAAQQVDNWDLSKQWALRLVKQQPGNLGVRVALFEQAMREKDIAGMKEQLAAIKDIQGEGAQWLYGQAVLLTLEAEDGSDARLHQALGFLERAAEQRPRWSRVPLLAAGIYERQGHYEEALDHYRTAVDLGETSTAAYRHFIQLLTRRGHFQEAQERLRQLDQSDSELSSDLERLRGGVLASAGQLDQALKHARMAAADSKEYADHLWYGRLAAATGQREKAAGNDDAAKLNWDEAERAFRRAVELEPNAADARLSLLQFYIISEQKNLAAAQLDQIREQVAQPERALVLASAYELLGEPGKAEEQYLAARKAQPDDPRAARALAEFYWRTNRSEQAEELVRQVLQGDAIRADDGDRRWARRLLARILTARGGYQNLVDATKLIDENLKLGENEIDRRMKVALDQAHPSRANREKAIEALERIVAGQGQKSPGDVLGLAQLYLAAGNWAKARPLLRDLVAEHPGELRYLATFVEAMLKNNETVDVQPYLDQLVAAAPNNLGTVNLQAEAFFRTKQYQKALDLLNEFVDRKDAEPADGPVRLRAVAGVLEQFVNRLREAKESAWARQFMDAAEPLYRRYVQAQPDHELVMAAFLARQGRTAEAVDMFERRWSSLTPANLAQMAAILLNSEAATQSHIERTERIIKRALEASPDAAALHLVLADARTVQGRYDEAEEHYRAVLREHPNHSVALNNLAVLLALQGIKLDEAKQLVDRAIEASGPVAALLDSRATVYNARGEYGKALADIDRALAEEQSPVWLFHKAQICFRAGKKQAAAQALGEAHWKGLKPDMLQPLEVAEYQKMQRALQKK